VGGEALFGSGDVSSASPLAGLSGDDCNTAAGGGDFGLLGSALNSSLFPGAVSDRL